MARRIGDMRKTHEEFMAEMKKKHPNIQITGIYHDRTTNIEWKCSKCGASQLSLPGNLLKPNATGLCRKCFTQQLASTRMKTNEEFLQELHAIHPEIIVKSEYQGASNKIEWKCLKCGESQFSFPSNLLKTDANGICRKCTNLELASRRTKTHEDYLQELHAIHPNIKITGVYQGNNHKIEWECPNCGEKIYSFPANLLKPTKTPYCKKCERLFRSSLPRLYDGETEALSIRDRNANRFYDAVRKLNNPPILLDAFQNDKSRIRCKCSVCGYEWSALPKVILSYKHPCPICANRNHAIDNAEFIQRLKEINPYILPLEEYYRQDQHIKCKCLICNHVWSVTPGGLLNQRNGCPKCNHSSTSFFEQLLFLSFQEVLGIDQVLSRDKKAIGSELDVYIPNLKLAFEYGAWYYHKGRLKNDQVKRDRCSKKGIRLIRIYDACGEERPEGQDVFAYSKSIVADLSEAKALIIQLFRIAQINLSIDDFPFEQIKDEAYILSRRITTNQFRAKIRKKHPNIEVLGEYTSSTEPITCKCLVCGNEWNSTPQKLSAGYGGCPNCYKTARLKSEEQFLEELKLVNADIELLEPYTGSDRRILAKCKICGYQWTPLAKNLLHGYGCSQCKRKNSEKKVKEIVIDNPDIEVIGIFQGTRKPIEAKCKKCGMVWNPIAYNLKKNLSHCPKCTREELSQKRRMSTEDYIRRLSSVAPTIELISNFEGTNNRVDVQCKICGYKWSPIAMDLLTGRGCRKCKYKKLAEQSRRTPEQFISEMQAINPDIIILGQYTKANAPVQVKCRKCERTWNPHAASLLSGTGCPSCSKKRRFAKQQIAKKE